MSPTNPYCEALGIQVPRLEAAKDSRDAICVLDAHVAAMTPAAVLAFVQARGKWSQLSADAGTFWRRGAPVLIRDDGSWVLDREHEAVRSARKAARARIALVRRWAAMRPAPATVEATQKRVERERAAHAEELARMRRVLVHAFPSRSPQAVSLLDVARREIITLLGEEVATVRTRLADYDWIGAIDVRGLLRALDFDPGERVLAELGPPQKTWQLNKRGRTLKITLAMLAQGTCRLTRPFGDPKLMRGYLRNGEHTKFRRRIEADAKSLYARYQYGRLHGAVRLRWGFLDERIRVPWVHWDEPKLYHLMKQAQELRTPLEVVIGGAPGWENPWARVEPGYVVKDDGAWTRLGLVDQSGIPLDEADVQLARLAVQKP